MGILAVHEAIKLAREHGVDLVEIAASAKPPVCRIVDFGKYQYEQSKKLKEQKKHQQSNKLKEIQLSPVIDPHDYGYKLDRAKQFLSEDMKVKLSLRFKGRQMAHTATGFVIVNQFIKDIEGFANPDSRPKLVGRSISMMLSPLPKSKRAKYEGKHHYDEDEDLSHGDSEEGNSAELRPKVQKISSRKDFLNTVIEELGLEEDSDTEQDDQADDSHGDFEDDDHDDDDHEAQEFEDDPPQNK